MELYTMERWKADRTFKAKPGQEIAADVYEEMLNCMPPRTLPQEKARQALQDYKIPVHAGFLMGEPHSSDKRGQYYLAFGMNAFVNDGLFPAAEFKDDADAIQTAANYEATLYKYEYRHGERISSAVLYEPRFM